MMNNGYVESTTEAQAIKGYILLVENDFDVRHRFSRLLTMENYVVYACQDEFEAVDICNSNPVDLALVDYRLRDDNNPGDRGGLNLIRLLDKNMVKILMSAFQPKIFGLVETGKTHQFNKDKGPEALVDFINNIFETEVQVNHALEVNADFEFDSLFNQVKRFRSDKGQNFRKQRFELDGLFKRLFFLEKEVQLKYIQSGYGGSGVVRVTPFYKSGGDDPISGADVVVKFGPVDNMLQEFDRYSKYVETFLGMRATDVVGSMKISGRLAGIKFRLIGSQSDWNEADKVLSFKEAFNVLTPDAMDVVITDLFQNTCRLWYAGKYQARDEKKDLAAEYLRHFSLNTDERLVEVEKIIETIIAEGNSDRLTVSFYDADHLEFDFNNNFPYPFILPNPLVFIEKHANILPDIYYRSITHGDLNEGNFFVDQKTNTWLIDFFKTGDGPALRDVIQLETAVKYFLYRETNLVRRLQFESAALLPNQFNATGESLAQIDGDEKVSAALVSIRKQAAEINGDEEMTEYYAGMLFNTLRVMTLQDMVPSRLGSSVGMRQRHALFSAALLAQKFTTEL